MLQLDAEENYTTHIVQMLQGRECQHFLQIFKGKMRSFIGKSTDYDPTRLKTPSYYLLQVEGSATYNSKAYQVNMRASSLDTNYCFVLRKNTHYYIWCGINTTIGNREIAKAFAGRNAKLIVEGKCHDF